MSMEIRHEHAPPPVEILQRPKTIHRSELPAIIVQLKHRRVLAANSGFCLSLQRSAANKLMRASSL